MKKIVVSSTMALLLSACSTHTFIVSEQNAAAQPSYDKMQHFFVGGLGQSQEVSSTEICGSTNTAKVQTQGTFLNGFLGMLSYGIYSPRDMRIYCK